LIIILNLINFDRINKYQPGLGCGFCGKILFTCVQPWYQ